jgi:hypothetical protein
MAADGEQFWNVLTAALLTLGRLLVHALCILIEYQLVFLKIFQQGAARK